SAVAMSVDTIHASPDFQRSAARDVQDGTLGQGFERDRRKGGVAKGACIVIDSGCHHIKNRGLCELPEEIMARSMVPFDVGGRLLDGVLNTPIDRIVGHGLFRPSGG